MAGAASVSAGDLADDWSARNTGLGIRSRGKEARRAARAHPGVVESAAFVLLS